MNGAEALQNIIDTLDELKKTINELKLTTQIIEANIKILNNRAAGLMSPVEISQVTQQVVSAAAPIQKQQDNPSRGRQLLPIQEKQEMSIEPPSNILTYKKVFGKLINNSGENVEGVLVKFYDKNNEVCATAETDPIGYYESMLRPGKYSAEYVKVGFKAINKTFNVDKNSKEIEIK